MKHSIHPPRWLGIEGGGTRTVALWVSSQETRRFEAGPGNLRLLSDEQWQARFREIAAQLPGVDALGIGLAGARTQEDRERIKRLAAAVWPGLPCLAANDLEIALAAAEEISHPSSPPVPSVLVLSGTGSCCYGVDAQGQTIKVGGWGHLLGDQGSGYAIGLTALKKVLAQMDRTGKLPSLGTHLLRQLQMNEPNALISWVQQAGKDEVGGLAKTVFQLAGQGDRMSREILREAATMLAADAAACAQRLAGKPKPVRFVLAGGTLLKPDGLAQRVSRLIRHHWPQAIIQRLERESVWGAVKLAERAGTSASAPEALPTPPGPSPIFRPALLPVAEGLSPTEERHPLSLNLDRMSLPDAVRLMANEDARLPAAILACQGELVRAIQLIVRAFRQQGRLFYVGAGTSGRLGILDASECPPTFRTPPEQVQGIIAGGQRAIWEAVEGAEDDLAAGGQAIKFRGVTRRDVVVGIAASGRTPFVWGALAEARKRGAKTILVAFNPRLRFPKSLAPTVAIIPHTGPELLTGSTRLKAGTATKMILNILTTLAMVKMGKVVGNLMVDLNPSNLKLRDRANRIVCELTHCEAGQARAALEKSGWVVKNALRQLKG